MPQIDGDDGPTASPSGHDLSAITGTVGLVGDRWHATVLQQLLDGGPLDVETLDTRIDGVTRSDLTAALGDLEDDGLVARKITSERPCRAAYTLTEEGQALETVIEAMDEWGGTSLADTHPGRS